MTGGPPGEGGPFVWALPAGPEAAFLRRRAYSTLGEIETSAGNFAAAERLLAPALVENPGDEYLLYMYSEALYNLGRHDEAKAALVEILQRPPSHECFFVGGPSDIRQRLARLALGEVLRVERALREAESILRGVADDFPTDATAWYFLGRVHIDARQWKELDAVAALAVVASSTGCRGVL